MNRILRNQTYAFTRFELLAIVAVVTVLGLMLISARFAYARKAQRIRCVDNLRQSGLAVRVWEGAESPLTTSNKLSEAREAAVYGNIFRYFQLMSNGMSTPKNLICPTDTRLPAKNFAELQNKNISYFVGLDATESDPQMMLMGDRNITNGVAPVHGIFTLSSNHPAGWTEKMHNGMGYLLLTDGSVQMTTSSGLNQALINSTNPIETNRLALPE